MTLSPAARRRKGHNFERWVVRMLQKIFGERAVGRFFQQFVNHGKCDIRCPVFWIECKVGKKVNPIKALHQAEENCPKDRIAVSICKLDGDVDPYVTWRMSDWIDFVEEWNERAQ